jgi:hypothetical protein
LLVILFRLFGGAFAYLFFGPGPVSSSRHLAGTEGRSVGRLGVHLRKRGQDLGLVVEHGSDGW